jgi:peptidoglycan/xylan/chitin deacetylase (PgdA/CDA1 family)
VLAVALVTGAGVPALAAGHRHPPAITISQPVAGTYAQRVRAAFTCTGRDVRCTARWRRLGTAAWHPARSGTRLAASAEGAYVFRVDARGRDGRLTRTVRFRIAVNRPPTRVEPRPAPPVVRPVATPPPPSPSPVPTPPPAATATPTPTPTPTPTLPPKPTATPTPTPTPTPASTPAPTCDGYVALTFDDGPGQRTGTGDLSYGYTDTLAALGWPATFFNVGRQEGAYVDELRHEVAKGMLSENHSMTHPANGLTGLTKAQIRTEIAGELAVHKAYVAAAETMLRPPEGKYDVNVADAARESGLTVVTWTVDTKDWEAGTTADQVIARASDVEDQDIVLMHDGYQKTLGAIPQIVKNLRARNLCPGRIVPATRALENEWGLLEYVRVAPF